MAAVHPPVESTADREIVVSRYLNAPRELVFEAFSTPEHVAHWWGPNGFSVTTHRMEFRPGGVWDYVMHGPDGTDYPNWTQYIEIESPARLVYDHGSHENDPGMFRSTVSFDIEGDGTRITMRAVFPTRAARDQAIRHFNAEEGGRQHLGRLAVYCALRADKGTSGFAANREIVTTRVFKTSRERLFRAWTDPVILARWWGPEGFTNTFEAFDLRPGGDWRFVMHGPDGADYPNHSVFVEVAAPERLVFDHVSVPRFRVVATFMEEEDGARVIWRMQFGTAEECATKRTFAVTKNEENLDRLEAELARIA